MGYSKNNNPDTIETLQELKNIVYSRRKNMEAWQTSPLVGADTCVQLDGQCGMGVVADLNDTSSKNQAICLMDAFYGCGEEDIKTGNKIHAQILISDVCKTRTGASSPRWLATKMYAHAGPVSTNPNTGHYVRHYTITTRMLVDIYNHDANAKAKKK